MFQLSHSNRAPPPSPHPAFPFRTEHSLMKGGGGGAGRSGSVGKVGEGVIMNQKWQPGRESQLVIYPVVPLMCTEA